LRAAKRKRGGEFTKLAWKPYYRGTKKSKRTIGKGRAGLEKGKVVADLSESDGREGGKGLEGPRPKAETRGSRSRSSNQVPKEKRRVLEGGLTK